MEFTYKYCLDSLTPRGNRNQYKNRCAVGGYYLQILLGWLNNPLKMFFNPIKIILSYTFKIIFILPRVNELINVLEMFYTLQHRHET